MPEANFNDIFTTGVAHHEAGRLREAEEHYRRVIAANPKHDQAHAMLAVIASQSGRFDDAIELILQAITLAPDRAEHHYNHGLILAEADRPDDAMTAYRRALAADPALAPAHYNLGNLLSNKQRYSEAADSFRRALALQSRWPDALTNLGSALDAQGRRQEAANTFAAALKINPNHVNAMVNLGNCLYRQQRLDDAIAVLRRAVSLDPANARAFFNLGTVLSHQSRYDEAVDCLTRAVSLDPNFGDAYVNLGKVCRESGDFDAALTYYRRALSLNPNHASVHSNIVYGMHFDPRYGARALFAELSEWDRRHAQSLRSEILPHENDRSPSRPLRIGYVSTEFWAQAEAHFVLPLLESHDRTQFEIHCYSTGDIADSVTERHRKATDFWHEAGRLPDAELAQQIRDDRIDILVDLNMHMRYNRLLTFARKPAPIQITWIAYPGGTGVTTIDYRFTDNFIDPPGDTTGIYAEQSLPLGDCWCAYDPLSNLPSAPERSPGPIRFGSLNNPCKINDPLLELWSSVLRALPDSQLLLLSNSDRQRNRIRNILDSHGVAPARVEFISTLPREKYLQTYHRIDIALDTLPYNGITTTCDALWMGVPVVTLTGQTACGRAGQSLLTAAGLPDLVAKTPEDFTKIAANLAADPSRLAALRQSLRQSVTQSPLMDGSSFARRVESAYRQIWRKWCSSDK